MRRFLLLSLLGWLAISLPAAETSADKSESVAKKGFGLAERKGMDAHALELLQVGWFYNWGAETKLKTKAQFVPMIYSGHREPPKDTCKFLLGYNEPDHAKQANLPVSEALEKWPTLSAKAQTMISPALAGNPLKSEWMAAFMKGNPKVDAIALHWYKGADAKKFIKDLEDLHAQFNKPIWVTEFAAQTAADSAENPTKWSQAKVNAFIEEVTAFMEKTPWVERYAWHNSGVGTSALFDKNGELTETGKAYRDAKHK